MKRLRRIWKDNEMAILCLLLSMVLAAINITITHRLNERERAIGDAYNAIEESLFEISVTQTRVEEQIQYLDHIYITAEEYDIPPELVLAIMKVESSLNPNAKNGRCYGLMQIHDVHCEGFNVTTEELFDLRRNTQIGMSLLSGLMESSDNLHQVLGKYNRGQAGYASYCREVGTEVSTYSQKVMNILDEWKEME